MGVPVRCGSQIRGSMSATSPQPESPGAAEIDFVLAPEGQATALALDERASGVEWRLAGYGRLPGRNKSAPLGQIRSGMGGLTAGHGYGSRGRVVCFAEDPHLTGTIGRLGCV